MVPRCSEGFAPVYAKCAAGGMTNSLGSGNNELSTAIINATSGIAARLQRVRIPVVQVLDDLMHEAVVIAEKRGDWTGFLD